MALVISAGMFAEDKREVVTTISMRGYDQSYFQPGAEWNSNIKEFFTQRIKISDGNSTVWIPESGGSLKKWDPETNTYKQVYFNGTGYLSAGTYVFSLQVRITDESISQYRFPDNDHLSQLTAWVDDTKWKATFAKLEDYSFSYIVIQSPAFVLGEETCKTPSDVKAGTCTHNTAELSWTPRDASQSGFMVSYRKEGEEGWMFAETSTPSITLTGLEEWTLYYFSVSATCSGDDYSAWTWEKMFRTEEENPVDRPWVREISVTDITENSAQVSWDGYGAFYHLRYKSSSTDWTTEVSDETSFTLTGLNPHTTYEVQVRAILNYDYGDWSSSVHFVTLEEEPETPEPTEMCEVTATGSYAFIRSAVIEVSENVGLAFLTQSDWTINWTDDSSTRINSDGYLLTLLISPEDRADLRGSYTAKNEKFIADYSELGEYKKDNTYAVNKWIIIAGEVKISLNESGESYDLSYKLSIRHKDNSTSKQISGNIYGVCDDQIDIKQGVMNVQGDKVQSTKFLRNGQLYFMYEGRMYDVQGRRIEN